MSNIIDAFGIRTMPWIPRVYLLLFLSVILLILSTGIPFFEYPEETVSKIIAIGTDALKVITGAALGSLTMAANAEWGKANSADKTT